MESAVGCLVRTASRYRECHAGCLRRHFGTCIKDRRDCYRLADDRYCLASRSITRTNPRNTTVSDTGADTNARADTNTGTDRDARNGPHA